MNAYGPYFGDGEEYDWREGRRRRQRMWAVSGAARLAGYADFLNGSEGSQIAANGAAVVSAELASSGNSAWRPILIGVATSAAALIVNRWIERTFFR